MPCLSCPCPCPCPCPCMPENFFGARRTGKKREKAFHAWLAFQAHACMGFSFGSGVGFVLPYTNILGFF